MSNRRLIEIIAPYLRTTSGATAGELVAVVEKAGVQSSNIENSIRHALRRGVRAGYLQEVPKSSPKAYSLVGDVPRVGVSYSAGDNADGTSVPSDGTGVLSDGTSVLSGVPTDGTSVPSNGTGAPTEVDTERESVAEAVASATDMVGALCDTQRDASTALREQAALLGSDAAAWKAVLDRQAAFYERQLERLQELLEGALAQLQETMDRVLDARPLNVHTLDKRAESVPSSQPTQVHELRVEDRAILDALAARVGALEVAHTAPHPVPPSTGHTSPSTGHTSPTPSPGQLLVIKALGNDVRPLNASQIAGITGRSAGGIRKIVTDLVRRGWAERLGTREDRSYALTRAGRLLHAKFRWST